MSEEIETTMRLIGVTSLDQLNPSYVDTSILERDLPQQLPFSQAELKLRSKL
jgi:isopentenyl diphosphate isomerase/L-lactate dehydrogenase-like FMN-dependent dehydrogenase